MCVLVALQSRDSILADRSLTSDEIDDSSPAEAMKANFSTPEIASEGSKNEFKLYFIPC